MLQGVAGKQMRKSIKTFIFYLLCCFIISVFIGCSGDNEKETGRESVGKIISIQIVPRSFMDMSKMQIITEQQSIVIYQITSVKIGAEASVIHYSNGRNYFTWDGTKYSYLMY